MKLKLLKTALLCSSVFFLAGCDLIGYLTFEGAYEIEGKSYTSLNYTENKVIGNSTFITEAGLYGKETVTEAGETCVEINHPKFDLYEVYSPKNEIWTSVIVCSNDDLKKFTEYYSNAGNFNYFTGKGDFPTPYIGASDQGIFTLDEKQFIAGSDKFPELIKIAEENDVSPLTPSKTEEIKRKCTKFELKEKEPYDFVKIFKISKDGLFYSNLSENYLYENGKLYYFVQYVGKGSEVRVNTFFCLPLETGLNSFFSGAIDEGFKKVPLNIKDYPAGYFTDDEDF